MSYKVTVIIPTYNSVEFLDSTIASIMNQSIGFENIELIIVDDYSTDNTQELINHYCEKYENIKTFESGKKTGTPGRARNIGIANSTAEYIMFIDHDDNYLPESVEKLYNAVTENSCDVAIGKFQTFGEQKIVPEDWITHDVVLNSIDEDLRFFSINNIWRMIFPKDFLNKNEITFPEGVFAEDLTFMIDAFVNASKIVFINDIVYNFRLRTGDNSSTSLSKGMHYLDGLIEGYNNTVDVLKKNNACKYYDTVFNQHLSCWISDVALSETIDSEDKRELVNKSLKLFDGISDVNPTPENNAVKNIIKQIRARNLDEAYSLMSDYQLFRNRIHQLEIELAHKTQQVAILQSTKGWFKYKTKNIKQRLKKGSVLKLSNFFLFLF